MSATCQAVLVRFGSVPHVMQVGHVPAGRVSRVEIMSADWLPTAQATGLPRPALPPRMTHLMTLVQRSPT